jgi:hypothetical protein
MKNKIFLVTGIILASLFFAGCENTLFNDFFLTGLGANTKWKKNDMTLEFKEKKGSLTFAPGSSMDFDYSASFGRIYITPTGSGGSSGTYIGTYVVLIDLHLDFGNSGNSTFLNGEWEPK